MSLLNDFTTAITIDLDAVAHNMQAIARHVGPDVMIYGVVKANAYGHGAGHIAHTILANGATGLAVGRTDEGIQLRRLGITADILNLCYTVLGEIGTMVEHDIIPTVNTVEAAQAVSGQAAALGKVARVHVKVDTGMGRFGQLPEEMLPFLNAISTLPNLEIEGIFTHFSTADERDHGYTHRQLAIFHEVLRAAEAAGHRFRVRHAANSAATLSMRETHLDAVRPGVAIYGMYPSAEVSREVPLKPALSLRSHLGRVRTLPAGSAVGYGRTFVTPRAMPVGLVPVGYGDGYHRLLSSRGAVLVHGKRAPIIGRICMDQFMVDLTAVPEAAEADEVVLIGAQGEDTITAEEVARWAETINYEVTTSLTRRLPRVYIQNGAILDIVHLTICDI
ncbi:MAG: alanine racemase [Anaerolineae bacterium]